MSRVRGVIFKGLNWSLIFLAFASKSSKFLKVFKLLKVAKPFLMFLSLSVSTVAYAFLMGPWLSVLFVALLLIHEMGHVMAMRHRGMPVSTPVFIPFLGAALFAPKFKTRDEEALVGYGGPLLGSIAALLVFGLYLALPQSPASPILLAGSYMGVFLNLFNLIPVSPLDGGRVLQSVSRFSKFIGLFVLAAVSLFLKSPAILLVWILILGDMEKLPKRMRAWLGYFFFAAMITGMALGYSTQPFWVDVIDCLVGALFVTLYSLVGFIFTRELPEEPDHRPMLAPRERLKWLVLYLGLAAILIAALVMHQPHLQAMPIR